MSISAAPGRRAALPTSTCPWSDVTTKTAPGGRTSSRSATSRSTARELLAVVLAQPVLVGDLVESVVVGVDEASPPRRADDGR